jgi:DNA-directed RNA polymerase subunit RPC12/RpoP
MSELTFVCKRCQQQIPADESKRGKLMSCPKCEGWITVPELDPKPLFESSPMRTRTLATGVQSEANTKKCPFCAETILVEAIKCKHCGSMLKEHSSLQPPAPAASKLEPHRAKYDRANNSFIATMPQMIKLAMHAVQDLGWKLDTVNETIGLVTFQTKMSLGSWSGISVSLNIEQSGENRYRVWGTGKQNVRGAQLLALDLGESKSKVSKAIGRMQELAR